MTHKIDSGKMSPSIKSIQSNQVPVKAQVTNISNKQINISQQKPIISIKFEDTGRNSLLELSDIDDGIISNI